MQLHMRSVSDPFDDINKSVIETSRSTAGEPPGTAVATAVIPTNDYNNGWTSLSNQSRNHRNSMNVGGGDANNGNEQESNVNSRVDQDSQSNGHTRSRVSQDSDCGLITVFFFQISFGTLFCLFGTNNISQRQSFYMHCCANLSCIKLL